MYIAKRRLSIDGRKRRLVVIEQQRKKGYHLCIKNYVCAKYMYTNVPCGGSCLWVFDYLDIKELEKRRISYDRRRNRNN